MRVYGRISQETMNLLTQAGQILETEGGLYLTTEGQANPTSVASDGKYWVVVQTDANGSNDLVYVTALCQCLLLNLNESPFWANNGIPAQADVVQQVFPDYYVVKTQQFFAPFFASLQISRISSNPPTYQVIVITNSGVVLNVNVPIPT